MDLHGRAMRAPTTITPANAVGATLRGRPEIQRTVVIRATTQGCPYILTNRCKSNRRVIFSKPLDNNE